MNEAAALAQTWMKDDEYAAKIKDIADRTPIRQREDKLILSLGKIIAVQVISFKEGIFFSRITTDSRIYRAAVSLSPSLTPTSEYTNLYDPWSTRWTSHAKRLISLHVIKDVCDPDKLQASINEQLRKLYLTENSTTWTEQNMISPEPVPFTEQTTQQFLNTLHCNENLDAMDREEEEQPNFYFNYNFNQ